MFLPLLFATIPFVLSAPCCTLVLPANVQRAAVPAPTTTSTAPATSSTSSSTGPIAAAWYPGWLGNQSPPSSISWSKYDLMTFAFATTTPDVSVISLDTISQSVLPTFVSEAKANGVTPLLSIGGWSGSQYFSTAVSTAANRTAFVQAALNLVTKYGVGGLDFDWEYPNKQGLGCNTISSADSANFLLFLQALRAQAPSNFIITAAVGITPWNGPNGSPLTDVSAFAKVLDHVSIMAYDIWGSWSTTVGPNAPLVDSCAPTQAGSDTSAVNAWTNAKFPANQIVLGVPAYGHSFFVTKANALNSTGQLIAYPSFDASKQPVGDKDDSTTGGVDQCGAPVGPSGVFNFWGLIDGGFLKADGTPASGIDYLFDECSQTPFVYNSNTQVMVSYDNAQSFAAKGNFINSKGLKGYSMWDSAGDYSDILIDSINGALGIETC